ncbi:MAG: hypothetical protein FWF85_08215 [Clostridiales bacterium]|nr:hypothetical protein [Clostridiales bacterium]MDR2712941.1 hypothetical protein [Clostridiales bacterium]
MFFNGCNAIGGDLWGCIINLIILIIVLEFLCNILGNNGCCGAGLSCN